MLENIKRAYIREKVRFSGMLAEINWIKTFVQLYLLLSIFLVQRNINISNKNMVFIFIAGIILVWFGGFVYDRMHMFHHGQEFNNERDFFVIEMRKEIKELKAMIKKRFK